MGKNLPRGLSYDKNKNKYTIAFKEKKICNSNNLEEILEKYEKIVKLMEEKGFDYVYEHRQMFQKNIYKNDDMKYINYNKDTDIYAFNKKTGNHRFTYKNPNLEKVKEIRDYYLENGEEKTIEKYDLYRNVDDVLSQASVQRTMNFYEGKTVLRSNTSGFTGVSWDKRVNKWVAEIKINYKRYRLGFFDNKEDAIRAREIAAENAIEYYQETVLNKKEGK